MNNSIVYWDGEFGDREKFDGKWIFLFGLCWFCDIREEF